MLAGLLVVIACNNLLLRDFEHYGIIFMTVGFLQIFPSFFAGCTLVSLRFITGNENHRTDIEKVVTVVSSNPKFIYHRIISDLEGNCYGLFEFFSLV
jgi:hypothetical protein